MVLCDAAQYFGATHAGAGFWSWADFATQQEAETFALHCALEGWGVYLSRTFRDRNRVMVCPDYWA